MARDRIELPDTRIFSNRGDARPFAFIGANCNESLPLASSQDLSSHTFEHITPNGFDKVISKVSEKVRLGQRIHNPLGGFSRALIQIVARHLVNTLSELRIVDC